MFFITFQSSDIIQLEYLTNLYPNLYTGVMRIIRKGRKWRIWVRAHAVWALFCYVTDIKKKPFSIFHTAIQNKCSVLQMCEESDN